MSTLRLLAVDDERDVLKSYQNILDKGKKQNIFSSLGSRGRQLFGDTSAASNTEAEQDFELVTCQQGDEAVEKVRNAVEENNPFAVAFVDVRMPPGPDGVWTARKIHELDPSMNIVIVTAYSDIPPQEIAKDFKIPARLFYIQKPFHSDEIHQFAVALGDNWKIQKELQEQLEFLATGKGEMEPEHEIVEEDFRDVLSRNIQFKDELNSKAQQIEEVNTALRVILREKERDRSQIEAHIRYNIDEYVFPLVNRLRETGLTEKQEQIIESIENNLSGLIIVQAKREEPKHLSLAPVELKVARMIKEGLRTKEIAKQLDLSVLTVQSHRKNIRKKLGLTNKKENLRTTLMEYL